jgi:hypothetical protein
MPDSDKTQDQILAAAARAQMEQIRQAKDIKEKVRSGATYDNG